MRSEQAFSSYGIKETTALASDVDRQIEEISNVGFTVVEGVLAQSQIEDVRRRIDTVYETQASEVGGRENLRRINDELVVRCLLAYDEYFLSIATNERILTLLRRLLGDYFTLLQQNAILNLPDRENYQTAWHRDLIYQHFIPSRPIAVSALICVDEKYGKKLC